MRQRTIKKQIWINQTEEKLLKEKSKKAGLTEAEFIRSCIKGYKTRQISGIANNINQIARVVNSSRYARNEDIEYLNTTITKFIRDFQKKIYSRGEDLKWQ